MNERKEGCWRFDTTLEGKPEKGIYCLCKGDRCNGGTVTQADLSPVAVTEEDEQNNEVQS